MRERGAPLSKPKHTDRHLRTRNPILLGAPWCVIIRDFTNRTSSKSPLSPPLCCFDKEQKARKTASDRWNRALSLLNTRKSDQPKTMPPSSGTIIVSPHRSHETRVMCVCLQRRRSRQSFVYERWCFCDPRTGKTARPKPAPSPASTTHPLNEDIHREPERISATF